MRVRAPAIDDASPVLEVLAARDIVDIGVPDCVLEDLLDEWRASDLDLAADSRVVEVEGRIVAYAMVRRPGTLVAVAPGYEGRGIGARLLDWVEARERVLGRWTAPPVDRLRQRARHETAASRRIRASAQLLADGAPTEELCDYPVTTPAGLRLRSLEVDRDATTLHALDAASFAGAPDYHPESLEAYREEHLGAHDLDPELSRVAELGGQIAASCWRGAGPRRRSGSSTSSPFIPITSASGSGRSCSSRRSVGSARQGSEKPSSGSRQATRGPSGSTSSLA